MNPPSKPRKGSREFIPLVSIFTAGVLLGLGGYTFRYAEGLSYFSANPKACLNCHIMRDPYTSWSKGPHHAAATCVECHLPHRFIEKYLAKAENGYHHSKAFTLQNFHEPIMIKQKNAAILQKNCVRCHQTLTHRVLPQNDKRPSDLSCTHCHADVGHGSRGVAR